MKKLIAFLSVAVLLVTLVTVIAYASSTAGSESFSTEGGITVNATDRLLMEETLGDVPTTFEITLKYPKATDKVNVLFGNYSDAPASRPSTFMYYVSKAGVPILYIRDKDDKASSYSFSKANLYTGEWIDLAIVIDGAKIHCYVDGVLKQSLDYTAPTLTPKTAIVVGGDNRLRAETSGGVPTGRSGKNYAYFLGVMKSLALYSDTRSAAEVSSDRTARDTNDENLLACYDFSYAQNADFIPDASPNSNTLLREQIDGGITFIQSDKYVASSANSGIPETIEAVFKLPEGFTGRGGIIYSNYAGTGGLTNMGLHIYSGNELRLWYENKTNLDDRVYYDVKATDMKIPTGVFVHVAAVRDLEAEEWRFYLNGKLGDTVKFSEFTEKQITAMKAVTADHPFRIGNDYRKDQSLYFKGELMSVAAYADVRTDEEIFRDVTAAPDKDGSLLAYYDMKYADSQTVIPDRSGNGLDVTNLNPSESDKIEGEGMTFGMNNTYTEKYKSFSFPHTVEAVIKLPVGDYGHRAIIGNYSPDGKPSTYQFRTVNGVPRLVIYNPNGTALEYRFTNLKQAELCTGEWQHLTLVTDTENREFRVYLNGVLEDTKKFTAPQTMTLTEEEINAMDFDFTLARSLIIGRNYATTEQYAFPFTGRIKSLVTYSDVRTAEEIAGDMLFPEADGNLTGYYNLERIGARKGIVDLSNARNDYQASDGDSVMYSAETSGMVFDNQYYYETYNKFDTTPLTFETVVKLPSTGNGGSDKVVIGNYYSPTTANTLNFEITGTVCHPEIYIIDRYGDVYTFTFDQVKVSTDYWEHVAVTFDKEAGYAYCYMNGLLMQKLEYNGELDGIDWNDCKYPHILGGDWQSADFGKFNRRMKYTALYTSARTAEQIYADARDGIDTADESLLVYYDCMAATADGNKTPEVITDGLTGKYDAHYFYPFFDKEDKDPASYDYSFAVVGDTQLITERYPAKLTALYDWLVANADAKKMKFVMGLGDICQNDLDSEWKIASAEIAKLRDAGIPQSLVCGGGHDSIPQFNKYLPYQSYVDAYEGMIEYGFQNPSNPSLSNAYHKFTVGETKYMVISLEWAPTSAHVTWANEVIAANPDYNVIITTHAYLYQDGTRFSTYDYPSPDSTGAKDAHNGDELWNALIRKHENIVMVLSGHNAVDRIVKNVAYGDHGNRIVEMLINPQETDTNYKGTGMIAMLYFSDGGKTVDLEYYSTDKLQYFNEVNQFSFEMPTVSDDYASINQASVSIGKDINVNYYVHLSDSYKNATMRFTMNGSSCEVTPKATEYSGLYIFTYRGVAPHLMGEEITAELIFKGEVIDTADPFSVESYARKLLNMDKFELTYSAEKTEALHSLLADLLDYGAAAQKYKDHATDDLVNEGVSSEEEFDPEAIESVKAAGEVKGESGAKFNGATVRFDSTTHLRFDFIIGSANLSEVTVEIGGVVYQAAEFIENENGSYSLYTEAITATQHAKAYTATLKIAGEEAHSVTYSVDSYVKVMHSGAKMGELAKAIYNYGISAIKFRDILSSEG